MPTTTETDDCPTLKESAYLAVSSLLLGRWQTERRELDRLLGVVADHPIMFTDSNWIRSANETIADIQVHSANLQSLMTEPSLQAVHADISAAMENYDMAMASLTEAIDVDDLSESRVDRILGHMAVGDASLASANTGMDNLCE